MTTMQGTERLIRQMLDLHPRRQAQEVDDAALVECLEACVECEQVCTACADACLGEPDVAELIKCIRHCLDCTAVCNATRQVATRQTELDLDVCRAQVMTRALARVGRAARRNASDTRAILRALSLSARRHADAARLLVTNF